MGSSTTPVSPRRRVRAVAAIGAFALVAAGALTAGTAAQAAVSHTVTFDYAPGAQSWVVPAGVTSLAMTVTGGSGGAGGGTNGGAGGAGSVVTGTLAVSAGQTLAITVGDAGTSAYRLETGDSGYDSAQAGAPGVGGLGWTDGGEGGHGSLLSRSGGGGGGSTAVVVDGGTADAIVAAAGAGGGGRGVVGFCFGGDGGAAGQAGHAPRDDSALPGDPEFHLHCLAEGAGGVLNDSDDGDGTNGGSVFFLGGGGGGGGASVFGDGLSGGEGGHAGALFAFDDSDPATPDGATGIQNSIVGLGGGGGGGAGGGTAVGALTDATQSLSAGGAGSVVISYAVSYATSTSVAVTPASPVYGAELTATVTVANLTSSAVPAGTVTVMVDGATVGAALPLVDGVAVLPIAGGVLGGGAHAVTASYLPADASEFQPSDGGTSTTIARAPTTTNLVATPTSVATGGGVSLLATVYGNLAGDIPVAVSGQATALAAVVPAAPTGTVAFYAGSTLLGTTALAQNGTATLSITPTVTETVRAVYSADVNYSASTSADVTVTVAAAPPTPTPTPTPVPVVPAGLANTGLDAAAPLPWALGLLALGLLAATAAVLIRRRRTPATPPTPKD
ncbi:Ig-like domain repeat protein [Herbiconiux sp. 11R-BC]|uniref:Ig-like domain repeat protein n=1 Tax=Herbiconiux sp. 11R-BC TaxID=3111637 RepID=UPI003C016977